MRGLFIVALLAVVSAGSGWAGDDFPIAGIFTKDEPCTSEAARREDLRVTISRETIESNQGMCTILNSSRDGDVFALHIECKLPGDAIILGDVTFKMRDQNILDFDDQDHTSPAVLYRCPAK